MNFLGNREGCTGLQPKASTGQAVSRLKEDDLFYQVLEETWSLPWAWPPDFTSRSSLSSAVWMHNGPPFSLAHSFLMTVLFLFIYVLSLFRPEKVPESTADHVLLALLHASHCDSVPPLSFSLSVSLSSQVSPGLPQAVQWGPLFSPHRGGGSEHGA